MVQSLRALIVSMDAWVQAPAEATFFFRFLRALIMSTDARVRASAEATFFLGFLSKFFFLMHVTASTI